MKKVCLLGVYYGSAGKIEGADKGAETIVNAFKADTRLSYGGYIRSTLPEGRFRGLKNLRQVMDVAVKSRELCRHSLDNGDIPFVIGGDHSSVMGNISAACAKWGPEAFGVLYLDAHCDINTPETSPSGNLHGMSLAALMGLGDEAMCSVAEPHIIPANVLFTGVRSIDPGEAEIIRRYGIPTIPASRIRVEGVPRTLERIAGFIREKGIKHLHLSVDLDVLDPSLVPGTGVPEKDGLFENEFFSILRFVSGLDILSSLDLVEFIPSLDRDGFTQNICGKVMETALESLISL